MVSEINVNRNMELFSRRIKKLRRDKSQKEVADAIGISRATIGYYENGERRPDIETISKLSQYFNVSCDYLIGITDVPTPDPEDRVILEKTGLTKETLDWLCELKRRALHGEIRAYYWIDTVNKLLTTLYNEAIRLEVIENAQTKTIPRTSWKHRPDGGDQPGDAN